MDGEFALLEIVQNVVTDVCWKMAKLQLEKCDSALEPGGHAFTVSTSGAYQLTLSIWMGFSLMRIIADQMSHGGAEGDEDVVMYNQEFVNILCGNIISQINRRFKRSARFGIPSFNKREDAPYKEAKINSVWRAGEDHLGVTVDFDSSMLVQVLEKTQEGKS